MRRTPRCRLRARAGSPCARPQRCSRRAPSMMAMARGLMRRTRRTSPQRAGARYRAGSVRRASSTGSDGPRNTTMSPAAMSSVRLAHAGNDDHDHRDAELGPGEIHRDDAPQTSRVEKPQGGLEVVLEGRPERRLRAVAEAAGLGSRRAGRRRRRPGLVAGGVQVVARTGDEGQSRLRGFRERARQRDLR